MNSHRLSCWETLNTELFLFLKGRCDEVASDSTFLEKVYADSVDFCYEFVRYYGVPKAEDFKGIIVVRG